jgi:hypothetical protein
MAGWLAAMLVMAIAGRETTRELDVFQIMEMRSVIGLAMLYPLIHIDGGLGKLRTARPWQQVGRNIAHYGAQFAWFKALTLTTFRDLPWNGPFYARLGFEEVTALDAHLRLAGELANEVDDGLPADRRCAMICFLD